MTGSAPKTRMHDQVLRQLIPSPESSPAPEMGIDRGFDLFPPLENTENDNVKWAAFLEHVTSHYEKEGDPNFTVNDARNIVFTQGERPTLKRKGYQFRRFSAKISGRNAGNVEDYLSAVKKMATLYFGDRIHPWVDGGYPDTDPIYGWDEVYAAAKLEE
ncbi:hypothetical protein C8R43DRAFT_1031521 [Mycena crocata]|nr:hypothetical protein C8R43DRAFT_1031521 [Mycena crocata]